MQEKMKFTSPIFKFQIREYAEQMFKNRIALTNIKDFRNPDLYDKKTLDEGEGTATYKRHGDTASITVDNKFIFCSTSHFFSESLFWAIREGKECCVLIKNPDEFYKRITKANEDKIIFDHGGPCDYIESRTVDFFNLGRLTPINTMTAICLTKPSIYSEQMEYRGIWSPLQPENASGRHLFLNADISDLLIQIEFNQLCEKDFHAKKTVTMTTKLKNGNVTKFSLEHPHAIHSPVIFNRNGKDELAFRILGPSLSGGFASGGTTGFTIGDDESFGGANILEDIESIEFH